VADVHVLITLIPLLPLAGFIVTLVFGRGLLARRPEIVSLAAVTASWVLSMIVVVHVFGAHDKTIDFNLFTWISAGSFHVQWGYLVDSLTAVMLIVVSTIGMLVHYYSIGYMRGDGGYYRFFAYLNLFMFMMFMLILANNYLLVFLGWEGVGLCSYLLISFWFHKKSASQAGKKAFLVNRVGDWGFMLGMFLMFVTFGSLQFGKVFAKVPFVSPGIVTWISLLLFVGAVGKSAQFPLHVWLPDAMEGPTPVSALIHAATMVNAGVYMIARSYPLVSHSHTAMLVVMIVGTFTAIYAACIALTQNDIKKVIAYSTISSLGFMFMALGAGAWVAAIFYLFAHGFFKGLLFLGSGSVIHSMSDEQDMRLMGGLRKKLPLTFWAMLIGALANVGLFPFAGFWAKDEILGGDFAAHYYLVWVVGLVTAFITAVFMFRLMFLTFWGENRASADVQHHIHESARTMTVPLVILAIPAALLGLVVGLPPDGGFMHHFLSPVFYNVEQEHFAWAGRGGALLLVSLVIVVAGIYTAYVAYLRRPELPARAAARVPWAYQASQRKFYMDEFYDVAVIRPVMGFALWLADVVDTKVIDGAVNGLARGWDGFGRRLRPLQTGRAQSYAFATFAGLFVLIILIRYIWGA
jgi:proton-translocating NADH-quinone oxidoreductase, chain L